MNFFLDTNILDRINLRENESFKKLTDHCRTYGQKIYVSDVVLTELIHHRKDEIKEVEEFLKEWNQRYRAVTGEMIRENLPDIEVETQIASFLEEAGVSFVSNNRDDIKLAIEAMYTGRKPAKGRPGSKPAKGESWDSHYKQDGMKDVFIWRAFIHLINASPGENFAFVSANSSDFADKERKKGEATQRFHPHLCEDLGDAQQRVVCVKGLHEVRLHHITPLDTFDRVEAMQLLTDSQDILGNMFLEANLETESHLVRVDEVTEKAVLGFGTFGCTVQAEFRMDETEQSASIQLIVDIKDSGYELRNASMQSVGA